MNRWGLTEYALLALGGGLLLGGLSFATATADPWTPVPGWEPKNAGLRRLRELGRAARMPDDTIAFLTLVAYGESGGNNLRGLGIPEMFPSWAKPTLKVSRRIQEQEARAAARAYRRNTAIFEGCGWEPEQYAFGSGGWFGMLPPYGLAQFKRSDLRCLAPATVFDPIASIVMGYAFGRGLQGWRGYQELPTVANLRMGWGLPSSMGNVERLAKRRARYERHARAVGLPASFLDHRMPRWPNRDLRAAYLQLGGQPPGTFAAISLGAPIEYEGDPSWTPQDMEAVANAQ